MDENNQYGNAITKPLPIGSIKKMKKLPSLSTFDLIVQSISNEDKIGKLFLINIEFDCGNASKKQLFFNKIYTPIFEKEKGLPACEKSVFQLLDAMRLNEKAKSGLINSYKTTAKTHATLDKKYAIPLYAEHLHFMINRCDWRITNIRAHYTFEQAISKKEFVIINQVSRQNAKIDVEPDFYKLLSNSNFGYNCRNNADNYFFNPIYDEIEELSSAKKYQNVFDQSISDFVSSEILQHQIGEEYLNKLTALDPKGDYFDARKNSLLIEKEGVRRCILHEKV